ncbi:BREX system Lon protease-like protein BrxL [Dysgonomonas sp. ZJ709]|uniref:BREX system Lon protease-like protein BrxL n=1 Tax=Dysgonomonas sp. ZJ709 TaxID=2709797 RepID=UPI0013EB7D5E|nr:BREX system Lon protease-like protein BrxL [Dysgonomonas sp. ZJ709]
MRTIGQKIKEVFPDIAILKDQDNYSVFNGRNLPSFVKDFLIRKYTDSNGCLDKDAIFAFLDKHIPDDNNVVKNRLLRQETVQLLTRFIITTDIKGGKVRFAIPDAGIKTNEAVIPDYVVNQYKDDLIDGEKWGVIKLVYIPPVGREKGQIELAEYKPFRPYKVDLNYFRESRKQFTTEEWIDVLLAAMEYNPESFRGTTQKLEFLTRLLIFVEPRLNMIELAPKGTGKSYVFGNLSKYGWLISGGKVSRAKLFYDKTRQQPGIMKNYDFITFDEIQTIIFQDPPEMQAILKSYLESGKATVDNYAFLSECSTMLMGNIPLSSNNQPLTPKYFSSLPESFRESALLDRFHGFIEGWYLPRMNKSMILKDWTLNVEYFSEVLHLLRTSPEYSILVNDVVYSEEKSDLRDLKAVQKMASAYSKLLFPHIISTDELDKKEFKLYCLDPAIRRRGIIKEQCHKIDEEFKEYMPEIGLK